MRQSKHPFSALNRSAGEIKRYRVYHRVIPVAIGLIAALLAVIYVISLFFEKYGSFTVSIKGYGDRSYALALSENPNFTTYTSRLNSKAAKDVTNIDGNSLPDNLNDVNGEHNGSDYIAYTFYMKNTGESVCDYSYRLVISRMTAGIDAAVRVRLYYNPVFYKAATGKFNYDGSYVDYAKPKTGGNGLPEIDPENRVMTNFTSVNTVVESQTNNFAPGDICKITVVIWIEGNDPDCTDDCLGGEFKVDMIMDVLGGNDGNPATNHSSAGQE